MPEPQAETRPMNVGYVLKKYPRISETFILNEILGIEEAGVPVTVFSLNLPDDGRFHAELAKVAAPVEYLSPFGSASTLAAFKALAALGTGAGSLTRATDFVERLPPEKRALLLVQSLALARSVRERGISHLHAHFMTVAAHAAYLAHVFTGVPFTVTAHAKDIYRETVDPALFSEVAKAAARIITVTDDNRAFIAQSLLRNGAGRITRIYNGIVLEDFAAPSSPREPGLILGVGRLVEKKGFHLLLRACRALLDRGLSVRCAIVGDGEERERLLAERDRLGLGDRATFTGPLPRADVIAWLKRAAVLGAPCIRGADGNQDALPTVLIEALAAGLPSVATRIGGIPEIVDDGTNGLLVADADGNAFPDACERLLRDPGLWQRLAAAGPAKARERFNRRHTVPELLRVFREAGDAAPLPQEAPA